MKFVRTLLIATIASWLHADAFITAPHPLVVSRLSAMPTVDDVSTDDFMKQLGHASQLIPLLHPKLQRGDGELSDEESAALLEVLSRQFSHFDGIRGFFAVYLTSPESLASEEVPPILAEAVTNADPKVMVPLACMNVIMPTAMTSVHKDAELKECASKTAYSGKKILHLLKGNDDVTDNCKAILSVCRGLNEESSKDLVEFWKKFFANYKYEDEQKDDIAISVSEYC